MSKYFSEAELVCKCCGKLPPEGMDEDLLSILDSIRDKVGSPVKLSCAYRCPKHNQECNGVPNSQHIYGRAADILLPYGWSVNKLAKLAEECGADGIGSYYDAEFVHVDTRGYPARWEE